MYCSVDKNQSTGSATMKNNVKEGISIFFFNFYLYYFFLILSIIKLFKRLFNDLVILILLVLFTKKYYLRIEFNMTFLNFTT